MILSLSGIRNNAARRCFSTVSSRLDKFKIAIVGTGPAGFYTAHHLLSKAPSSTDLEVDFFERLPAPHGLSRYGVAPDHPEVKNCEEYLDNLMNDKTMRHKVRLFGNVEIGRDILLKELEKYYNSIVLSYGCTDADNRLDIPGGELPGVISAREFVNWYNGHPNYYSDESKFVPPPLNKIEDVTIIGNGNVALDVARVLLADPEAHWSKTDIANEALDMLRISTVKNVNIVARRGFMQSAFSNKELRELLELSKENNIRAMPIDNDIVDAIGSKKLGRIEKRRFSLVEKYQKIMSNLKDYSKTWHLRYLMSPLEFVQNENDPLLLSHTILLKNEAFEDPVSNSVKVRPTKETIKLKNELVILSIGYKGSPLNGFDEIGISFERNKVANENGRVLCLSDKDGHNIKKGWYSSGWIKLGPKGVIANTMMESFNTAENILEDLSKGIHTGASASESLDLSNLNKDIVNWENWSKLNDFEISTGLKLNKNREKVCNKEEMLRIACK